MPRITISLAHRELDYLRRMAKRHKRGVRSQARYLILMGLAAEAVREIEANYAKHTASQVKREVSP